MDGYEYELFLSYSRKDRDLVRGLRDLLSLNGRRVFWDEISILPGQEWKRELETAVRNSEVIVLLWCCDTSKSKWVQHELRLAVKYRKRIVPVLLCSETPTRIVRRFQWVNLMMFVRHDCAHQPMLTPSILEVHHSPHALLWWFQTYMSEVAMLLTGGVLANLAIARSFPSSLGPSVISFVNSVTLLVGSWLVWLSSVRLLPLVRMWWRLRRNGNRLSDQGRLLSHFAHSPEWYSHRQLRGSALASVSDVLLGISERRPWSL